MEIEPTDKLLTSILNRLADSVVKSPSEIESVVSIICDGFFDPMEGTIKLSPDAINEGISIYKNTIHNDVSLSSEEKRMALIEQFRESIGDFKSVQNNGE